MGNMIADTTIFCIFAYEYTDTINRTIECFYSKADAERYRSEGKFTYMSDVTEVRVHGLQPMGGAKYD